ncbi:hypothetical protein BH23CHL7_BH23CHL7_21440 [soil metagenome]
MADWKCTRCSAQNAPEAATCHFCGADRDLGTTAEGIGPAAPTAADWQGEGTSENPAWASDGPAMADASQPYAAAPAFGIGPGGLVGGVVGGLIAALLASAAWYGVVVLSGYQIAFVAVAVGWLVGTAVVVGARQRVSWPLVSFAVVATLAALFVSEYLVLYHFATELLRAEAGILEFELIQPIDFMFELVAGSIEEDPVTLLFWAVALFFAASIPFRALRTPDPAAAESSAAS